jgi:hypothetical protein
MTTAGGGWTLIFEPSMMSYSSATIGYTLDNMPLRGNASEALIAFRMADRTVVGTWARFMMPVDWQNASPFTYGNTDATIDANIGTGSAPGGAAPSVTLRYGWHEYSTDCAGAWNTGGGQSFGRVCVDGTSAPFFAGFDDPSGDFCQDSTQSRTATTCSSSLQFTIAVR